MEGTDISKEAMIAVNDEREKSRILSLPRLAIRGDQTWYGDQAQFSSAIKIVQQTDLKELRE